jgi:hypothetical protein
MARKRCKKFQTFRPVFLPLLVNPPLSLFPSFPFLGGFWGACGPRSPYFWGANESGLVVHKVKYCLHSVEKMYTSSINWQSLRTSNCSGQRGLSSALAVRRTVSQGRGVGAAVTEGDLLFLRRWCYFRRSVKWTDFGRCAQMLAQILLAYGMVWQSLLLQCVPCVRACLWHYSSVGQCLRVGVNFCGITGGTGGAIVTAFIVLFWANMRKVCAHLLSYG